MGLRTEPFTQQVSELDISQSGAINLSPESINTGSLPYRRDSDLDRFWPDMLLTVLSLGPDSSILARKGGIGELGKIG